eukprot:gb/GEZJ01004376.1/.p1 GENE.gb/GEZJ01004376.1/~~gb/GEZJ01004376.1/.p1  ORF type:complete len:380 (-),score=56.14 gb/GEZJ01004376.1/:308-1423(-)
MAVHALFAVFVALALQGVAGRPEFVDRIPNGDAWERDDSGIECRFLGHTDCVPGAARNPFGLDFKAAGLEWNKDLCEKDSDGDGITNGEELGDPCCEWTVDNPTQLRLTQLSHPGVNDKDGAREAPLCPSNVTPSPPPSPSPSEQQAVVPPQQASASPSASPSAAASAASASPSAAASISETPGTDSAPTATPSDDDDVCFPASALVQLADGTLRRMDQIAIGDMLHVGHNQYSPVFMFTHQQHTVSYPFISLQAERMDQPLLLTSGHFVYASGRCVPAAAVKKGDWLELADGSKAQVLDVSVQIASGLYNPQTLHGDLIVNGVRVTTYTTSVESITAHSLLAPLRALYQMCAFCEPLFKYAPEQVRSALL